MKITFFICWLTAGMHNWINSCFSSEEQSAVNSSYFNIELEMTRIFPKLKTGYWFYVEQAVKISTDKPYQQELCHLEELDQNTLKSSLYSMNDTTAMCPLRS